MPRVQFRVEWYSARSPDGKVLGEELAATLDALPEAIQRPLGSPLSGYLELHIEQGPSLERENIPIGIVHAIQGTRWLEVVVTGQTAHAGTTQLSFRRDPLVAVTEALQELYNSVMPNDERARLTIGRISVEPASINAIPGKVSFSVDLRHPDAAELAQAGGPCSRNLRRKGVGIRLCSNDPPNIRYAAGAIFSAAIASCRSGGNASRCRLKANAIGRVSRCTFPCTGHRCCHDLRALPRWPQPQ